MKFFNIFNRKPAQIPRKRSYSAAKMNRLTNDWVNSPIQINQDIKASLKTLKTRCREAAKNDAHFKKYLKMRQVNIVGDYGIKLIVVAKDAQTQKPDTMANDIIERAYKDFSRKEYFSVNGKMSRRDMENFITASLAYDGEVFIRKIKGFDNKYNYSLQILDSLTCDLNYSSTRQLNNGNYLINGVEVNDYGRPVAYYFNQERPDYYEHGTAKIRIPTNEIIHLFIPEFPGQTRGVPLAVAGLLKLNDLAGYTEAEIIAARIAASKMGFYTKPKGDSLTTLGAEKESDDSNNYVQEVSAGTFEALPEGWDFKDFNPTHPTGNHANFVKATLREIANAWSISYNEFANDLEGVNYSSIRQGVLFERDCWKDEQQYMIEHFETEVFNDWLEVNLLNGILSPLPYSKLNKFRNSDRWQARRWQWVDPTKDASANEIQVRNGWKTNSQVASEQGNNYADNLQDIAKEEAMQDALGLVMGEDGHNPPPVEIPDKLTTEE